MAIVRCKILKNNVLHGPVLVVFFKCFMAHAACGGSSGGGGGS